MKPTSPLGPWGSSKTSLFWYVISKRDEKVFWDHFDSNLIYCEDTHSFVHRLHEKLKSNPTASKNDAQNIAWDCIKEMFEEWLKDNKIKYTKTSFEEMMKKRVK